VRSAKPGRRFRASGIILANGRMASIWAPHPSLTGGHRNTSVGSVQVLASDDIGTVTFSVLLPAVNGDTDVARTA
jgi:hypothetical protein